RIPVDGTDFTYCCDLLLFRNANCMDLLPSFVGPRGCSGVAFTVRGHYLGAGLHDLPGLETAEAEGVSVNSRIGACVESRIARRGMGLSVVNVHEHGNRGFPLRVYGDHGVRAILSLALIVSGLGLRRRGTLVFRFRKVKLPNTHWQIALRKG